MKTQKPNHHTTLSQKEFDVVLKLARAYRSCNVSGSASINEKIKRALRVNGINDKGGRISRLIPVYASLIPPPKTSDRNKPTTAVDNNVDTDLNNMKNKDFDDSMNNANSHLKKHIWRQLWSMLAVLVISICTCAIAIYTVLAIEKNNVTFQFTFNVAEFVAGVLIGIGIFMAGITYSIKTIDDMNKYK